MWCGLGAMAWGDGDGMGIGKGEAFACMLLR